jgi:PRC-barrel domain
MQSDTVTMAGRPVETQETNRLISSEKVDGTAVYNGEGQHLGSIHHMMIDKFSGHVEYASAAKLQGGGPILNRGAKAMSNIGWPPPRIVICSQ